MARARPCTISTDPLSGLSLSERQVVLVAAEGLTNPEDTARPFVSPRTVGCRLYRSFTKPGVSSRGQLTAFLPSGIEPTEMAPRDCTPQAESYD